MTPSWPIQFLKSAAGSISKRTVEPRGFSSPLRAAHCDGKRRDHDRRPTRQSESGQLQVFLHTFAAAFKASLSLNGQAPLMTRSSGILSIVAEVFAK